MNYIDNYLSEVINIANSIDRASILNFAESIKNCRGRIFVLGVGGSAANASHAVNDFRKILNIECYALSDNVAELTARINDDGWNTSYLNSLKVSKLNEDDIILVFSVGGGNEKTSINLVEAMKYAKQLGCCILSIVSRNGGYAKECSDVCIMVPVVNEARITPHAEEWQMVLLHLIVNMVYEDLC